MQKQLLSHMGKPDHAPSSISPWDRERQDLFDTGSGHMGQLPAKLWGSMTPQHLARAQQKLTALPVIEYLVQEETCPCRLQCQGWVMSLSWAVLAAQPADPGMLQPEYLGSVGNGVLGRSFQRVHGYTSELLHSYTGTSHPPSWPVFGGKCWSFDSVKTLPRSEMQLILSKNLSLTDQWKEHIFAHRYFSDLHSIPCW